MVLANPTHAYTHTQMHTQAHVSKRAPEGTTNGFARLPSGSMSTRTPPVLSRPASTRLPSHFVHKVCSLNTFGSIQAHETFVPCGVDICKGASCLTPC